MEIPKCKDKTLIEGSKKYFDNNKKINQIFVTPDGQYFLKYKDTIHHGLVTTTQAQIISRDMLKSGSKEPQKKKGGKSIDKK